METTKQLGRPVNATSARQIRLKEIAEITKFKIEEMNKNIISSS